MIIFYEKSNEKRLLSFYYSIFNSYKCKNDIKKKFLDK